MGSICWDSLRWRVTCMGRKIQQTLFLNYFHKEFAMCMQRTRKRPRASLSAFCDNPVDSLPSFSHFASSVITHNDCSQVFPHKFGKRLPASTLLPRLPVASVYHPVQIQQSTTYICLTQINTHFPSWHPWPSEHTSHH